MRLLVLLAFAASAHAQRASAAFAGVHYAPPTSDYNRVDVGLYQDSGATTPATANNDPVGYWLDSSRSGRSPIQTTAGSRPVLQTATLGVKFDGTDDHLIYTGAIADTTGTINVIFRTGATDFATRGDQALVSFADNGTANTWLEIGIGSDGRIYIESNAGGTKHTVVGSSFLAVSTSYLLSVSYDGTAYFASLNGVEQNPLSITNIGTFAWIGNVSSVDNFVIGGTVTSAGLVRPFQGEVSELLINKKDVTQ
jgi:hypothetical protein